MKLLLILLLSCGAAVSSGAQMTGDKSGEGSLSVDQMIEDFYSGDPSTLSRAKEKLMKIAQQSPESRSEVVQRLITVLDDPRTAQVTYSNAWYASAELLGGLKAKEAIDALVRHLDYTNGVAGLSSSHVPAVKALTKIGKPAVPTLSVALSDYRPSIREKAAQALGGIGGEEAMAALESASKSETDKNVQFYIAKALQAAKR